MREIITIQVGRCGNKISSDFWTNVFQEHKVDSSGAYTGDSDLQLQKINTYFHEHEQKPNHFFPRATLIDLEPMAIDEIRAGPFGALFGPNNSTIGHYSAGNSFAKGFYSQGEEWIECALDVIRHQVEQCDRLQGFQMTHSLGGGTGSGMGCLIASKIKEEYPGILIQSFPVFPSPKVSDTVVEPYNAVLALNHLMEHANIIQVIDNEALYDICYRTRRITKPTYRDLNYLVAETMTAVTCTYRFPGELDNTMRKMATNLVPFPGVPYLMTSFSEVGFTGNNPTNYSLPNLMQRTFDAKSFICSADPRHGRYLSASLVYRGKGSLKELDESVLSILNRGSSYFVEWLPNNLKGSFCEVPQGKWKLCSVLNSNSTAIQKVLKNILEKFSAMFRRKAFVYGYGNDGMDEMEFVEAESRLNDVISEYQMLQDATAEEEEEFIDEEWEA